MKVKSKKRLKIVIISHYFLPHVGGIEVVVYNQAKELAKRGHEVVVISSKIGNESEEELMDGFKVKRVNAWNIFERKWGVPYPVISSKIFSVVGKEVKNSDIVHVHDVFYLTSFVGSLLAQFYKKPLILMQHIKKVNDRRKIVSFIQWSVFGTYSQYVLNNSKKIITCNKDVMKWIGDDSKTIFLENCADTKLFKPTSKKIKISLRKKYNLPLNKPIIIFTGRMVEKKGFHKLFEARDKNYFIVFVGDGVIPEYMKKDKDVKFVGFKKQKELAKLYPACNIFCLPSINEGFPLTILEAMACGLPIITTDHPGYTDYLDRKFVKLIEPNTNNIKKAIKEILNSPKKMKEMGEYSRDSVEKRFSWKRNGDEIIKIYEKVLK